MEPIKKSGHSAEVTPGAVLQEALLQRIHARGRKGLSRTDVPYDQHGITPLSGVRVQRP